LVAPSANPQGKQPAETSAAAQAYFEDAVDFYVSGSKKAGKASTIVDFTESIPRLIRQGSKKIPKSYLTS
jgi:L-threonylcarbamoyladenylate synthase